MQIGAQAIEPVAPGETRVLKRLRGGCICFLLSLCEIRTNQEVRNENTAHPACRSVPDPWQKIEFLSMAGSGCWLLVLR